MSETPPQRPPSPTFAEPHKWFAYHIAKDWGAIVKAPIAFASVVGLALLVAWLVIWKGVVPQKDEQLKIKQATIESKDTTIKQVEAKVSLVSEERDKAQKENEKMSRELAAFQAAHADKSITLKRRALILANQIQESINHPPNFNQMNEWNERFGPRLQVIISEADVLGRHSEKLEGLFQNFVWPKPSEWYKQVSSELTTLANSLPED